SLCSNFLRDILFAGGSDSPHSKVMRGQITLSQLFLEVDKGCRQHASAAGISLPTAFSIAHVFEEMAAKGTLNAPLLQAAGTLRRNGFKTCVFTNNWVDDSTGKIFTSSLLTMLQRHFDLLIESCRVGLHKPDPRIYTYALEVLQAQPQEVIFLDDLGENLKPAREMGMATILVRDTDTVLKELQELSGVQLLQQEEPLPTACDPATMSHGYVPIRPGVQLHFMEMGHGPVICLCHGFPECWLSWRYQIPALADAGFRVIALEMKGYGESTAPPGEQYPSFPILPKLMVPLPVPIPQGIPQAVFIGHDWGGAVVWNMALFYPERVRAVASLNTPYQPADPTVDIVEKMKSFPMLDYQFYFQKPGVAEAELEKDIGRTLKALIRSTLPEDRLHSVPGLLGVQERGMGLLGNTAPQWGWAGGGHTLIVLLCAVGGMLVGFPEDLPESLILHGAELQYYIERFQRSGFRGPLNWYRNIRPNWHWALSAKDRKILMPALMVTAGKDVVLVPRLSKGMEEWIPQLRRGHLETCGHWTQMERPAALNKILVEWLEGLPPEGTMLKMSRL
ncbi:HYES hydrolase, partial [Odontophorus gujanensis]|nr:HYES hydrolase [Odontophorus gujanensis]